MQKAKADEPFAPMIVADMLYDMEERDRLQSGHVNARQVSGSIYSACRFFKMFQQTDLKSHISTKTPKAPVFNLPHETSVARMRRNDLAGARKQWLAEAKGESTENSQRQQSQFLTDTNHEGELINFHSLRHTCGAWLAMTGTRLNVVQQVMRHQTITLTMDTYGHLLPGQEADAVGRMRTMLVDHKSAPEALRATGTDCHTAKGALQLAQQLERETRRSVCDGMRYDATHRESSGGGIRTTSQFPWESVHSRRRWGLTGDKSNRTDMSPSRQHHRAAVRKSIKPIRC